MIKAIRRFLSSIFNEEPKQRTWVWCRCGNEMVGDTKDGKSLSFVRDVYMGDRNIVHYKCSKCGVDSYFDFDFPTPIALPLYTGDDIINRYNEFYASK